MHTMVRTMWWCYLLCNRPNMLSWFFCSVNPITQYSTVRHTAPFWQIIWFRAIRSVLFLLNDVYWAEKQQIPMSLSLVWFDRCSSPRSTILEASMLTITPPLWSSIKDNVIYTRRRKHLDVHKCYINSYFFLYLSLLWTDLLLNEENKHSPNIYKGND